MSAHSYLTFDSIIMVGGSTDAGIEINVLNHGVELKQVAKEREIFLSKEAWLSLSACRAQLDESLRCDKEIQCTLDEKRDIRAHTNTFKDKTYLHIRSWWNGRPTRTGVSMLLGDWDLLKLQLDPSDEMKLGLEVLRKMLTEGTREAMRDNCEGCVHDWPSQRDHECLMNSKSMATYTLDKLLKDLSPAEFISLMAAEAYKEGEVILEMPHQTLKRILSFHLDELKKEILSHF